MEQSIEDIKNECFQKLLLLFDEKEDGYIIYRCKKMTMKQIKEACFE
jgi:predicted acetyltransferase